MERVPVSSSNISSVGYDPKTQILEIEFHGGRLYHYYNVPLEIYEGLMSASSHGKYLHQNIIDHYRYQKV